MVKGINFSSQDPVIRPTKYHGVKVNWKWEVPKSHKSIPPLTLPNADKVEILFTDKKGLINKRGWEIYYDYRPTPSDELAIERKLGREVQKRVEGKYPLSKDKKLISRAKRLLNILKPFSPRNSELDIKIKVLDTDMINAFSLPGGTIYLTKGIMKLMNDEELLFVIGHELGHIDHRHSMERLKRASIIIGGLSFLFGNGFATHLLGAIYNLLIESAFSRDNEYEADESGFRYLAVSGHNVKSAITALEKLRKMEKKEPNLIQRLVRDHPPTKDRIKNLKKVYKIYKSGELILR